MILYGLMMVLFVAIGAMGLSAIQDSLTEIFTFLKNQDTAACKASQTASSVTLPAFNK